MPVIQCIYAASEPPFVCFMKGAVIMEIIMVHGGVQTPEEPAYFEGILQAASAGWQSVHLGPVEAVEQAVIALENNPLFSAGLGSVLSWEGFAEMDAAIMDGDSGRCGAVAAIQDVSNPVTVARLVMEKTRHVLLAGEGARQFARSQGIPPFCPVTTAQRTSWEQARQSLTNDENLHFSKFTGLPQSSDTVGALVLSGNKLAAASSTGGTFLKLRGRVGDTPVIGAGLYASKETAVVCTGHGERFIELNAAARAVWMVEKGFTPMEAAAEVIHLLQNRHSSGGIMVLSKSGYAAAHNETALPAALMINGVIEPGFTPVYIPPAAR